MNEFNTIGGNADIEVNGIVVCRADILFQGSDTKININYVETYPSDITTEDSENIYRVISWIY